MNFIIKTILLGASVYLFGIFGLLVFAVMWAITANWNKEEK